MANILLNNLKYLISLIKYSSIITIPSGSSARAEEAEETRARGQGQQVKVESQTSSVLSDQNSFDDKLGHYLSGLIEGDGYISITKENRVILGITFNIKDRPLAEKLLNYLALAPARPVQGKGQGGNKGFIAKRKTNSVELRISDKQTLLRIIKMINGKFRTPKIQQLHKLVDWVNKKYSMEIPKLPVNNSPLDSNSWLAGFIEADGTFYIRYSLKQIICKFNLEQRMIYPKTNESYYQTLIQITEFLNVKLGTRNRENYHKSYYIIRVENQKSIQILIDYLNEYSLLSSKYLDYLEWKQAFKVILAKKHFTDEGRQIILLAKNNMNDNRTKFNWDHLKFLECR